MISHVSSGRGAIFSWAAAKDTKLCLLVDYTCDGYVKMNYADVIPCCLAALCRTRMRTLRTHTLARARL